jgi:hypothetical protein
MAGTEAFHLEPPTAEDLKVAKSAWDAGTSRYTLRTDDSWWRVLRAKDALQAEDYARSLYPSDGLNRFTPVRQGASTVPSAYAGSTNRVALWEIVLRGIRHAGSRRVPEHEVRDRFMVQVRALKSLTLLDVRRPRDANLVTEGKRPPDLTQSWPAAYGMTRAWAQALHDTIPRLSGIIYESHQVDGDCIVLFKSDDLEVFRVVGTAQRISATPVREVLISEALKASAGVDFGTDDEDAP